MNPTPSVTDFDKTLSKLSGELQGSEIIKLAAEIREKIKGGSTIYNYTIGDFDPKIFPIPSVLEAEIIKAYQDGQTNYPPSNGIEELRETLSAYISERQGLHYDKESFLVAGGGRPLIYAAYQILLDRGEKAIFPVPSWNNNHYTHLTGGQQVAVQTSAMRDFMPTAADLKPHMAEAGVIALCSPLNPTGTVFDAQELSQICDLVLEENERRKGKRKPVYIIYDQIYWQLCFGDVKHVDPVGLNEQMRPYTLFIDGISKAFSATGVRVGWAFGPQHLINKMKSILGHIGAWAPKPEQVAVARFMANREEVNRFMVSFKTGIHQRLEAFYLAISTLAKEGLPVSAISPKAAMYLTVKIDLVGLHLPDGKKIANVNESTAYLLDAAGLALVPFSAFGGSPDSPWYRLSVGTAKTEDIPIVIGKLRAAIQKLY